MRWLLWFALVPQLFLLDGVLRGIGGPGFDVGVALCLFLAWYAEPRAIAVLLLGAAIGRAIVDEAVLPVQILVLGVPVAVLLPLRGFLAHQRYLWQAVGGALCAVAVPKLAWLCGVWFAEPSASAFMDGRRVVVTSLLLPPVLWCLRRLPPLRAFAEVVA
jgi:hypothetical protein